MPVDLEHLAAGYAHRPSSLAALDRARRAGQAARLGPGDVALDMGGGRGGHAAVWLERGALPVVVDPARGMIVAAARQPGVAAICASAQNLPVRDACARLAYFHLSVHYGDWRLALDQATRALSPGGELWIWTMGEEHHRGSFLAKWFPSVGDIDSARFPDPTEVAAYLEAITSRVETGREVESKSMLAASWRAAAEARFVSTLQLISEDEFARGLAAFDTAYPDPGDMVGYILTFDWIRGAV